MEGRRRKLVHLLAVSAAFGLLLAGACGTTDGTISKERIFQANKAIGEAKESNASLNAPVELKAAEEKMAEAQAALAKEDYEKAMHLAEQASIDADYARARATAEKAKRTAEAMRQNIKALLQEIERMAQ